MKTFLQKFQSWPFSFSHLSGLTSIVVVLILSLPSCGPNAFKSQEKKDPGEDAAVALEDGKPEVAISILEKALDDEPENQSYLALIALAYAQKAGVDPLSFIENMAGGSGTSSSSSSSSSGDLTGFFGIMPDATSSNISDVDKALDYIMRIPAADYNPVDKLKLAMFQTAAMTLRAKALDKNKNGKLEPEEVLQLTPANALTILLQMANAGALLSGDVGAGEQSKKAAEKITKIQAAIEASEGTTQEEKLKTYLATTGGAATAAPTASFNENN